MTQQRASAPGIVRAASAGDSRGLSSPGRLPNPMEGIGAYRETHLNLRPQREQDKVIKGYSPPTSRTNKEGNNNILEGPIAPWRQAGDKLSPSLLDDGQGESTESGTPDEGGNGDSEYAGALTRVSVEDIAAQIEEQLLQGGEDLLEEDAYLLEINLGDLQSSTGEQQEYWLLALKAARVASQITRGRLATDGTDYG